VDTGIAAHAIFCIIAVKMAIVVLGACTSLVASQHRHPGLGLIRIYIIKWVPATHYRRVVPFGRDIDPTANYSFEVSGPYHRRQEGNVDKSIKWTSTDNMNPQNEWETIETVEEN
jgi:hypothetical protein